MGGKIEHSHVTNYYFLGIINEKLVTGCLNWAAWLIILVLIGNTISYTCSKNQPLVNTDPVVKAVNDAVEAVKKEVK